MLLGNKAFIFFKEEQLYQEAQLGPLEDLFDVNSPYPEGIPTCTQNQHL